MPFVRFQSRSRNGNELGKIIRSSDKKITVKNFNNLAALRGLLQNVYETFPSEPERRAAVFAEVLEQQLDFTSKDAALYASIVLTRNGEGSADWVGSGALKILGTWIRMSQEGMSAALLKSVTETWKFSDDLTGEHKWERYEGYVSPFGSSYSVPSSNSKFFIWASSDLHDDDMKAVILSPDREGSVLTFAWFDKDIFPRKCSINGETFIKQ